MAFSSGATPFGVFDSDLQFQSDADKLVTWIGRKLGDSQLCVELSSSDIYSSFEEAALEYSAIVNQYQFKSVAASVLGMSTGSLSGSENKYPHNIMDFLKRQAEPYGEAAGVGGSWDLMSGSFTTVIGQQQYDLQTIMSGAFTGSDGRERKAQIKEIFHFNPTTAYRFFGTTSAVNYLNNQFGFESFTPETIFYMLPVWEDILRGMQFETSNRVRRSQYSYDINNNNIRLYPPPADETRVHFTYWLPRNPYVPDFNDPTVNGTANMSNVPFGNLNYSQLNSISKQWIWKMTMALSKEILGQIRSKMVNIPIPNGDLTLNGPELINDGRAEQDRLRSELKEMLDATTYQAIAQREAEMVESVQRAIKEVPLGIYVGIFWLVFINIEYLFNASMFNM